MNTWAVWKKTTAGMLAGRRFSPRQIEEFRRAVWEEADDGRIEVMMLFFAEALRDVLNFGHDRTAKVLRYVNEHMVEWSAMVDKGEWDVDDLRKRVFEKTGFIFAMHKKDQEHIAEMLTAMGHKVVVDEPKEEKDG